MDVARIQDLLKAVSAGLLEGKLDRDALAELSNGFEEIEGGIANLDEASKLRYFALQPFIAEQVGLPDPSDVAVVMKNWGRQHIGREADEDGALPGDVTVIMKNWGRQHIGRELNIDPKVGVNVVLKNWGRQT